ncbi:MAG: hypothetical protein M0Z50_08575, partial [Planctomycetia bacterium]|nr:hypothetical protein [Planctomycetia bacterium]
TAIASLVGVWTRGGRCTPALARLISQTLIRTQRRNTTAERSHRKRTIQRLHMLGLKLKDMIVCDWSHL